MTHGECTSGADKKAAYASIAKLTYDFLLAKMPGSITNDMQKRLRDLEAENAALKSNGKPKLQALGAKQTTTAAQAPQQIEINRGDREKLLASSALAGAKQLDIDNWIKTLKLTSAQQKQVIKLTMTSTRTSTTWKTPLLRNTYAP